MTQDISAFKALRVLSQQIRSLEAYAPREDTVHQAPLALNGALMATSISLREDRALLTVSFAGEVTTARDNRYWSHAQEACIAFPEQ